MQNREKRIRGAYRASKNYYDKALTGKGLWSKFYMGFLWKVDDWAIRDRLFTHLPDDFSGRLLDVPVGTGLFTAEKYRVLKDAKITALDYSEDMLARARRRFAGADNVLCVQGDVGKLPYADGEFDAVLSMNGFHAFPDKDAAFSETARVLKKGGLFLATFYIKGERKRTDWMVRFVLAKRGWFTPPFWTKAELETILHRHYGTVELDNVNSMVILRCVKGLGDRK
ncbi:MAG: class I SAM-dependent methyltransferase [Oscillospiraceae bacterium]|jgi:ubiquinone/menaquinone biosynthesis C-methylase UbiE|nr:class I SAM-dependent methyltransferase [Oscillospiraceae bacterium]